MSSLCLVSANLAVAIFGGGPFTQVHTLEQGVFAVFLLDGENGFLPSLFPFQIRFFSAYFVRGGEDVHLEKSILWGNSAFWQDVGCADVDPADQKIGICDPVKEFHHRIGDQLGGSGLPGQIGGAVGVLGHLSAVIIRSNFAPVVAEGSLSDSPHIMLL